MKYFKSVFAIFLIISALFAISCRDKKSVWKGTITTEDGVMVMQNPKEPMYGEDVFDLEEDLSVGESTNEGDYLFSAIRAITVDDAGNIYVLDRKENQVLAFDSSGKHLRTFGRKGQGPADLSYPVTIGVTVNGEDRSRWTRQYPWGRHQKG